MCLKIGSFRKTFIIIHRCSNRKLSKIIQGNTEGIKSIFEPQDEVTSKLYSQDCFRNSNFCVLEIEKFKTGSTQQTSQVLILKLYKFSHLKNFFMIQVGLKCKVYRNKCFYLQGVPGIRVRKAIEVIRSGLETKVSRVGVEKFSYSKSHFEF